MCGRFSLQTIEEAICSQFNASVSKPLPNSTNLAPTESALCIIENDNKRQAIPMRWGFTPWYAKGKKIILLNARSEDIINKAAFKDSVQSRRCLLIMSGFFEWQHHPDKHQKQPFLIYRDDKQLMAIAAIWQNEKKVDGSSLLSCCLLTTEAKGVVSKLHHRMPLMLSSDQQREWLAERSFDKEKMNQMLSHQRSIDLCAHRVTTAMNSALYKAPDAILPL